MDSSLSYVESDTRGRGDGVSTEVMHARELLELAALVSTHAPLLIEGQEPLPLGCVEQYWVASKSRLDRWGRSLKQLSALATEAGAVNRCLVQGVCEEVLTGEVLTRVWAAAMSAYDRRRGTDIAEPIARSVYLGHLEARHRVLTLLVSGPGIHAEEAVKLNRLRRRTERWTDVLVGRLSERQDLSEFAIDPERAREFAGDLRHQSHQRGGRFAWPLTLASLRAAFQNGLSPVSPNADLNEAIAASILSCFHDQLFDSTGLLHSPWLTRLTRITNDTQGMIDELLCLEGGPSRPLGPSLDVPGLADRARRLRKQKEE
jgi:hypothetical protein